MAYLWMLTGSVFFAIMALLAESVKEQFSFPWITTVRSGVATMLALGLCLTGGAKLVVWRPATLWARSISGWIAMIFGFYAMTHYNVEIVLALTNSYPIWVAVLSWPLLGRVPSGRTWLALLISCLGMWMVYSSGLKAVVGEEIGESAESFNNPTLAIPSAILASILSAVALINLHRLKDIDARAIVTHFSAVATTASLIVWMLLPQADPLQPATNWGIFRLITVGIAATAGQLFLTKAFASGPPTSVSIVGLSQVAVAAAFKWLIHWQPPSLLSILGMLLVMISTVWVMVERPDSSDEPTEL